MCDGGQLGRSCVVTKGGSIGAVANLSCLDCKGFRDDCPCNDTVNDAIWQLGEGGPKNQNLAWQCNATSSSSDAAGAGCVFEKCKSSCGDFITGSIQRDECCKLTLNTNWLGNCCLTDGSAELNDSTPAHALSTAEAAAGTSYCAGIQPTDAARCRAPLEQICGGDAGTALWAADAAGDALIKRSACAARLQRAATAGAGGPDAWVMETEAFAAAAQWCMQPVEGPGECAGADPVPTRCPRIFAKGGAHGVLSHGLPSSVTSDTRFCQTLRAANPGPFDTAAASFCGQGANQNIPACRCINPHIDGTKVGPPPESGPAAVTTFNNCKRRWWLPCDGNNDQIYIPKATQDAQCELETCGNFINAIGGVGGASAKALVDGGRLSVKCLGTAATSTSSTSSTSPAAVSSATTAARVDQFFTKKLGGPHGIPTWGIFVAGGGVILVGVALFFLLDGGKSGKRPTAHSAALKPSAPGAQLTRTAQ